MHFNTNFHLLTGSYLVRGKQEDRRIGRGTRTSQPAIKVYSDYRVDLGQGRGRNKYVLLTSQINCEGQEETELDSCLSEIFKGLPYEGRSSEVWVMCQYWELTETEQWRTSCWSLTRLPSTIWYRDFAILSLLLSEIFSVFDARGERRGLFVWMYWGDDGAECPEYLVGTKY